MEPLDRCHAGAGGAADPSLTLPIDLPGILMKTALRAGAFGAAGLTVVALVALMSWALSNKTPVTSMSGFTRVQQPAAEFTLPLFEGGDLVLSDVLGRPIVLNFWASWCAPCRDEAAGLERTWRAYRDRGVIFVGLDIQDSEQDARDYVAEFDITYPNGRDADGKITVDYGVVGLPVTFFVNKKGIVERRWVGAITEKQLVAWVDGLVAGEASPANTEGEKPDGYRKLR